MSSTTDDRVLAGRYRLEGLLGVGGMAEVHLAWDVLLRRPVAVKLFRVGEDAVGGRRFDNEVRTLASLSHPGLVAVYDTGTSGSTTFVVLQLIDGGTLRDRVERGPMPVDEVRELGSRLAETLGHVHERGVVHRDVKPSNILLDQEGVAYLADFGLARSAAATRLTNANEIVGTAAYLAPEQVRGEEIGPAADVYALGLVLLECLTGRREYRGTETEAAVARLHRRPEIPRDLPTDLSRLLTLMTSLSPRRRPAAAECARLLGARRPAPPIPAQRALPSVPAPSVSALSVPALSVPAPSVEPVDDSTRITTPPHPRAKLLIASAAVLGAIGGAWAMSGVSAPVTSAPPTTVTPQVSTPAPAAPAAPVVDRNTAVSIAPVAAVPEAAVPEATVPADDSGPGTAPDKPGKDNPGKGKGKGKDGS